jgi:F0F1-type ATP synthase assembly protein I
MDKEKQQKARSLALVTGFVFEIVVLIGVGFIAGRWLDGYFETSPLWTVGLMLGLMFFGIIRLIVQINKLEDKNGSK